LAIATARELCRQSGELFMSVAATEAAVSRTQATCQNSRAALRTAGDNVSFVTRVIESESRER
jgi:hypothetical protein